MIATVVFLLQIILHGSNSWILSATNTRVHLGEVKHVTLTCHLGVNSISQIQLVDTITIYKHTNNNSPNPWTWYAKVHITKYDPWRPVEAPGGLTVRIKDAIYGATGRGSVGNATQSYLSVTWNKTTLYTSGTYMCQVLAVNDSTYATTPRVTLVMAGFRSTRWPDGKVALLKADKGCPITSISGKHVDGFVKLHTESSPNSRKDSILNYNSASKHMAKPNIKSEGDLNYFYLHTCIVGDVEEASNETGKHWPEGSYCVFGTVGPDILNFIEAFVELDLEHDSPHLSSKSNTPFFANINDYNAVVRLNLKCREDGDPLTPIELPTEVPFFLFRIGGRCQEVAGANVTEESFTVATNNEPNKNIKHGYLIPDVWLQPVHFVLCYYQEID